MKNNTYKKRIENLKRVLLLLSVAALVSETVSHAIVGYEPSEGSEGEMHIMSEYPESEDVHAMPTYEKPYGRSRSYEGEYGRTGRAGMDDKGRMVRPGPRLDDPEEVMATGINDGQGEARITESGEVRALTR